MKQIIAAVPAPFTNEDRLDVESAARLYEFSMKHGIDGLFVHGTMGEWALLTDDEKDAIAEVVCSVAGNAVKVMLGVTDTGLPNIMRNMERQSRFTHAAWTLLLPGGWAGPDCPVRYMHRIADACDRPLYLYYTPGANGVNIRPEQFRDVLSHPRIAGIKNSAGSMRMRRELLLLKESVNFELYEGEEWAIDEALIVGCDGTVAGLGSVAGKIMKDLAGEVDTGNYDGARKLQYVLIDMFHRVYGSDARWWCAGNKHALHYLGVISSARTRVPSQQELPETAKTSIRACIDQYRHLIE